MKKWFLVTIGVILWSLFQDVACHGGEPTDQVSTMLKKVRSIQVDPQLQGTEAKIRKRAAIKEVISKNFDFDKMAQRALDTHWKQLMGVQRADFEQIFRSLFLDSYTRLVLDFLNQEKIQYTQESIQQGDATVKTVILRPQEQISVDYLLSLVKETWLVYDVKIDGISIVENYRKSFARVIQRESYNALVEKMRLQQRTIADTP